jgi:hypothetical protein
MAVIVRIPISKVASGTLVRVRGRLRAVAGLVVAPLTGTSCVLYQSVVLGTPASEAHVRLAQEHSTRDLLVDDGTGSILVRVASGAHVQLAADRKWDWREFPLLSRENPLVQRANATAARTPKRSFSFSAWEGALEEGAALDVTGWCQLEPDPYPSMEKLGYRGAPEARPVLVAPSGGELQITNQEKPGGRRMKAPKRS